MIEYGQDLSPVLGALIIAAVAWYARMNANWRAVKRTRQMEQAAEIMHEQARNLEKFLDDPAAPRELKRLLIEVSDAMGERDVARKIAEWASSRPLDQPVDTDETRAIGEAIDFMGKTRPDLVESFGTAIFTAVVGASLQWPETAAILEQTLPRLVVTPKHNAAIAATATSFRPGLPFSMRPPQESMA